MVDGCICHKCKTERRKVRYQVAFVLTAGIGLVTIGLVAWRLFYGM